MTKFILDTHLFIDGMRDEAAKHSLEQFHRRFAPFEYFSVIVAQELRSGARTAEARRALERYLLTPFERAARIVAPSPAAWHRSGDAMAEMARAEGFEIARLTKSFANDILLAISCREAGCVLVTANSKDFERIRRFVPFSFVPPWPGNG